MLPPLPFPPSGPHLHLDLSGLSLGLVLAIARFFGSYLGRDLVAAVRFVLSTWSIRLADHLGPGLQGRRFPGPSSISSLVLDPVLSAADRRAR